MAVKNPIRGVQLSALPGVLPYLIPDEDSEKTVLGGSQPTSEIDPPALKSDRIGCGWLEEKTTERKRKNRDPWICKQWWLHWEEPGGKKRSRYVPKKRLADVEHSVYVLKRLIDETLKLLEKK
jgi:hypothetical protein